MKETNHRPRTWFSLSIFHNSLKPILQSFMPFFCSCRFGKRVSCGAEHQCIQLKAENHISSLMKEWGHCKHPGHHWLNAAKSKMTACIKRIMNKLLEKISYDTSINCLIIHCFDYYIGNQQLKSNCSCYYIKTKKCRNLKQSKELKTYSSSCTTNIIFKYLWNFIK